MPHVLVINPNTRAALTAQLVEQLRAQWRQARPDPAPGTGGDEGPPAAQDPAIIGATASFGADYIASESTYVVAAHAVLHAWDRHLMQHGRPLAVLVACFGDPGVWALRETAGVPVMGLAEAAMREAQVLGPYAIVTGGAAWGPMLERLARGLQLAGPRGLRRVNAVPLSGGELMADPAQGARVLGQACAQVLREDAADETQGASPLASIILGGAALGGWCDRLDPPSTLPMIDSVAAGGRWLRTWC